MNTPPGPHPPTSTAPFVVDPYGFATRQSTTLVYKIPREVVVSLGLPLRADLADNQQRGASCVWCGCELTGETAVSLDELRDPGSVLWFPRACRPCVRAAAQRARRTHPKVCDVCVEDSRVCETSTALRQLGEVGA